MNLPIATFRRAGGVVLRLAVGAALLVGLVIAAGPGDLLAQLGTLDLAWLAIAGALYTASLLLRGLRIWVLLKASAPSPGWVNIAACSTLGWSLNNVLPFRIGDIIRLYLVSRHAAAAVPVVLLAFVAERALDVAVLGTVVLGGVTLFGLPGLASGQSFGLYVFGAMILVGVLGALASLWVIRHSGSVRQGPRWLDAASARVTTGLGMLREALWTYFRPGTGSAALALSVGAWVLQGAEYGAFFQAMGITAQPLLFALGFAAFMLTFAVNFVPGQVGTFEALFVAAFAAMGVSDLDSLLAVALVTHVANTLFLSLLGLFSYLKLGMSWSMLRGYFRSPSVA